MDHKLVNRLRRSAAVGMVSLLCAGSPLWANNGHGNGQGNGQQKQKDKAARLARKIAGVKSVDNQLQVVQRGLKK